ncbi:hypothetical protein C3L23_02130 [Nautilia sp. PV-1]|jgi:hypothetical protein|uniref:hypothetical protein n=1 Tax=Nautilia sp. PV-1 TaxID=2579250 RepID=UPI000FDB514A|nr:hypothetical protein [Nautilia sp. PV-1]AZV46110.1 hypothetical protein C3L23_02130 [Nautilia sp. PV-1]
MISFKDKNSLCKKLGYNNLKPCLEKLKFLEKNGIEAFLKTNFKYDFVLGSELFLKKVIELYGNDEDMKIFEKTREKLSRKSGHLFVNTNFKRVSQPIFVLAFMEGLRNILIDRASFENKEEELAYIRKYVKKHYKENNGKLELWGNIQNYIYKSEWFDKYLVIDKDGNVINQMDEFNPSKAFLKINGKNIEIKMK